MLFRSKIEELAREVKAFIVTLGAQGSLIHTGGKVVEIPSATPEAVLDPTGCGDAFRAGLLYGITHGMDWAVTGRLASLLGALKIARRGPQNHDFNRDSIADLYQREFGAALW